MEFFYSPNLVALSLAIGIFGSLTALTLTSGYDRSRALPFEINFMCANAAVVMGTTIWSLHFIAMLAVELPILINYNLAETVLSMLIAIVMTGVGLFVASTRLFAWLSIPLGGVLMGLGVACMHYLGMYAIRGCGLNYAPEGVALSIVIAIAVATVALGITFSKRGVFATIAGGIIMGLAIGAMHYTAMASTFFVSLAGANGIASALLPPNTLAYIIACATVGICCVHLTLLALSRLNHNRATALDAHHPR